MRVRRGPFRALLIVAVLTIIAAPEVAYASWSGGNAAAYADTFALNPNQAGYTYPPPFSDDCTDFTSQAINQGGLPEVNFNYLPQNDNAWFAYYISRDNHWYWSNSWSVAGDQWQYLYNSGHGHHWFTQSGAFYMPGADGLSNGDLLYYAWTTSAIDHVGIQVAYGADELGYPSSLQDQHTNNRYHVNYTLWYWNPKANTTTIYGIHVTG